MESIYLGMLIIAGVRITGFGIILMDFTPYLDRGYAWWLVSISSGRCGIEDLGIKAHSDSITYAL